MKKLFLASILSLTTLSYPLQPHPLKNFNCSCYTNAAIQSLYSLSSLTNALLVNQRLYPSGSWAHSYTDLIVAFSNNSGIENALQIFYTFVDSKMLQLTGLSLAQQDPTEFLEPFLAELKEKEPVKSILNLELETITKANGYARKTPDPSNIIKIPIAGDSLQSCLNEFFKVEQIDRIEIREPIKELNVPGEYKPGTRQYSIKNLPTDVILAVNRFDASLNKIPKKLEIPLTINFSSYTNPVNNNTYELVGVIIHIGATLYPGHYVAYAKHGDQWWWCDDTQISKVSLSQLVSNSPSIKDGYVFFYQKKKRPLPTPPTQEQQNLKKALTDLQKALNDLQNALQSNPGNSTAKL